MGHSREARRLTRELGAEREVTSRRGVHRPHQGNLSQKSWDGGNDKESSVTQEIVHQS